MYKPALVSESIRCVLVALLVTFSCTCALAQRERNNIYLFDCTGSMKRAGLWEPAKDALEATITTQSAIPGSDFTVIPFGDKPYEIISFGQSGYGDNKAKIYKAFDRYVAEANYTRITDVLKAAFACADPNKDNNIYLLTDGMPNGGDSTDKVAATITSWCNSHRNSKLFYVALTTGVVDDKIKAAIDKCPDAFIVQCVDKVIPQIVVISSDIYTNLEELGNPREISFSVPGNHPVTLVSSDSIFDINAGGAKADNGKVVVTLSPRGSLNKENIHQTMQGGNYTFEVDVQCSDKRFIIANPSVTVHVSDGIQTELTLGNGEDEIEAEGAKWHDAFLWSDAAPSRKIVWDLNAVFKHQLNNSALTLSFTPQDDNADDFTAWFNGNELKNGENITIRPGSPALLELTFDSDATTGKRYFTLTPVEFTAIDLINGNQASDYEGLTVRTRYSTGWNPLATLLFWIGVILLAALILWLAVINRIVFPRFSRGVITVQSPYYAAIRVRGARKVVMTSSRQSQGFINKLFTGKIIYHVNPEWTNEAIISPSGKNMRFRCPSGQLTSDPLPLWQRGENYTIRDTHSGKNLIEISIN